MRTARLLSVSVTLAVVGLGSPACSGDEPSPDATPTARGSIVEATESVEPLPDLAEIGRMLVASDDPYLGRAQVPRLQAQRRLLDPNDLRTPILRVDLDLRLFEHALRLGEVDEALADMDVVMREAAAVPGLLRREPELYEWQGIGWLRKAEVVNCIGRHAPACCVFPFAGDGLHAEREPARRAVAAFLRYLELVPDDLGVQWLAHVAASACAEPELVPERFRVPPPPAGTDAAHVVPRFVDRAPALGVDAFDLCGGAIVTDVDGDGFLDLISSTFDATAPMKLFRNHGDGTFEDRSAASGLARQLGGLNCIAADYDNDGDQDVLVLRGAWQMDRGRIRNSLLRNDGHGHFEDVTFAAGLATPARPTQTAVWADFDGDGDLDLYVGNESRREIGPQPERGDYPSQLFRNDGDGTFTDVAARAGVTNDRYCKGVTVGDYDDDGDLDLYVSNVGANRLYRNDGELRFTDVAGELGVAEPTGRSFACWFFDYDNDGRLDLFVASYAATLAEVAGDLMRQAGRQVATGGGVPRLYRNVGGRFVDVAREVGLDRVCLPMGAGFADVDGDGWLDIYLATGEPSFGMIAPNLLFRNDAGRRFVDVTTASGLGHLQKGHGVAFADVDHDGDVDLFHQLGGFYPGDAYFNALFENLGPAEPVAARRFVELELEGRVSNRAAVGARVRVDVDTPAGPRSIHRAVGSVSSFGGAPLARLDIGLGDATRIARIAVRWPAGGMQEVTGAPLDAHLRIVEGVDGAEPLERPRLQLGQPPIQSRSRK
ncbi:MAG: CRTAC1 family protein [Planctomycetes bacterium]|nr:CRTAC1 family protein [Planctomycetota bacterium]